MDTTKTAELVQWLKEKQEERRQKTERGSRTSMNLYMYRTRAGISQKDLAFLTGFSVITITNLECQKTEGRIDTWQKIAAALEIPFEKLFNRPEDNFSNE